MKSNGKTFLKPNISGISQHFIQNFKLISIFSLEFCFPYRLNWSFISIQNLNSNFIAFFNQNFIFLNKKLWQCEAKNASHFQAIFIFYNLINRNQCPFFLKTTFFTSLIKYLSILNTCTLIFVKYRVQN